MLITTLRAYNTEITFRKRWRYQGEKEGFPGEAPLQLGPPRSGSSRFSVAGVGNSKCEDSAGRRVCLVSTAELYPVCSSLPPLPIVEQRSWQLILVLIISIMQVLPISCLIKIDIFENLKKTVSHHLWFLIAF